MIEPLLFLSHAGEEEAAARELARLLDRAGVPVWLDVERLRPGDRWMDELQDALRDATAFAVYVGRSGVARWVGQEVRVALDRSVAEEGFTVIPILGPGADPEELPVFLRQHHWVDLRDGLDDAEGLRELAEVVVGEDRRGERLRRSLLPPDRAPFLGLRPFGEEDAFLFYGRDREVEELLAALGTDPFLAVVGASGCGKSSLVRAGLLPALRRGRAPGSGVSGSGSGRSSGSPLASWRIAVFRPADDLFRELAAALPDLDPELGAAERMEVGARIASSPGDVERAVAALVPAGTRTLLVADQLEEVFTQTADPDARRRFLDALLAAGRPGGDRPVHVLVTLRADFYSRCWEHPDLPRRIAANQYPVERMARDQLREVVEKPLALAGVTPEPGLADELLDDAGDEPGNLPLLEHALFQLWDQPASRRFTHEAYREMGGLAGALEHHAETVFEGFDPDDRDLVRRLLLCLVVLGEAGAVTRRRTPKGDLLAVAGEGEEARERAAGVLGRLVEARLLTATGGGEEPGEERVEVAHEALLRSWDRLRGWLEEDREFLLWRQRLTDAVAAWERSERSDGELLRGGPLRRAESWLERRREDLTPAERDLIEASLALEAAERERRVAQARRLAAAVGGVALLLLVTLVGAVWLYQREERRNRLLQARGLADRVDTVSETRPQLGTLLALHALRLAEGAGETGLPEGETALRTALARLGGRVVGDPAERVLAGAVTEDLVLLATTDRRAGDLSLRLRRVPLPLPHDWQIAQGEAQEVEEGELPLFETAISPDGRLLVAKRENRPVQLWALTADGRVQAEVPLVDETGEPLDRPVEIAQACRELTIDGRPVRWEESDAAVVDFGAPAPSLPSCLRDFLFWDESGFDYQEPETGITQPLFPTAHESPVRRLAHTAGAEPGRGYLLTWNEREPARLWHLSAPDHWSRAEPRAFATVGATLVALSPGGRWLAGGPPGTPHLWHVARADGDLALEEPRTLPPCGDGEVALLDFAPDGAHLLYGDSGPGLCLAPLPAGPAAPLQAPGPGLARAVVGPDAAWIAAVTIEGELHLRWVEDGCGDSSTRHLVTYFFPNDTRLAVSRDGRWLASADASGLLRVDRLAPPPRCAATEVELGDVARSDPVTSLAFGASGRLVAGFRSGGVWVWTLEEEAWAGSAETVVQHPSPVGRLAFDASGARLASSGWNGSLILSRLGDGNPSVRLRAPGSRVDGLVALAFRDDGDELVTVDESSHVTRWTLDLDRLKTLACRAAGRDLSLSEAREYLGEEEPPPVCPGLPPGVD